MWENFLYGFETSQSPEVGLIGFIINLVVAGLLAFVLSKIYERYGNSLSNRRVFGKNFVLLTMTTMLIISIVRSSLALSLGLIGALSIVRFRAAIKEPEELVYLFLSIAVGLGLGANQRVITFVSFLVIVLVIIIRNRIADNINEWEENTFLTITTNKSSLLNLSQIHKILQEDCRKYRMKRFDSFEIKLECTFIIEIKESRSISRIASKLHNIDESAQISFLDHKGVSMLD